MKHKKHLKKIPGYILLVLKIPAKMFKGVRNHARSLEARSLGLPPGTSWEEARRFFKNKR